MRKPLGVGLVGAGNIAAHHILAWQQTEGATPVAVCRRDENKVKDFAHKFNLDWATNYNDLLQRDDIDIIDIVLPSGLHADVGVVSAIAGKHVLVEKPIDVTLKKADDLITACREYDVTLGVVSQYRFMDGMLQMNTVLQEGKLGQLIQGDAYIKWYRPQSYYDSGAWRGTWELDGGGPFMNQGIHFIDLLLAAMGPVKSVYAKTKTLAHNIDVEDIGVAILEFQNGAYGIIEASTATFPGLPAQLDIHGTKGTMRIEGDKLAFLHIEGEKPERTSDANAGGASNPMDIDVKPFVRQFTDIIDAVRTKRQPTVSGEVARRPLQLILAIYESSKRGEEILFQI
ncbi:gfo/Idh/MocA family oxidoreductase [candidate division KSB1 bacterium]|nr:Gfo/Idh/MocA family oxidoreductase [candidate division KSB1 bacterium]RQW00404.1 MAG: gfo/Idh/MocA family oxidoreductase [candidate division KSB1 bacterium]